VVEVRNIKVGTACVRFGVIMVRREITSGRYKEKYLLECNTMQSGRSFKQEV
jgi:hypothetical protein